VQAALLAGGPVREPSLPTGGTMEIRGQEVKPGILRLEMGIVPLAPGDAVITDLFPAAPGQASVDCPNERVTICCLDSPCWIACGDARCPKAKGEVQ
jgi:hypothetical protein